MWRPTLLVVTVGAVAYSVIRYFSGGRCQCSARLDGLVVIVTGAGSGIGKALAQELACRGAEVVLAIRNTKPGELIRKEIISNSGNPNVHIRHLDLNSFNSIIKFSYEIQEEFEEIYALVNNAGVFYHPHELTEDGFDVTLQTNYLGPFILTHYLLKALQNSEHARIINVSSEAHRYVNQSDLEWLLAHSDEPRNHFVAYGVSKLAIALFTRELSRKLHNSNIVVNTVNPGNVETDIYRNFPPLNNPWLFALQYPVRLFVVKTPKQGAQTALHALLTSRRTTGQYLTDCRESLPSPLAINDKLAEQLYQQTLEVLGSRFSTESDC